MRRRLVLGAVLASLLVIGPVWWWTRTTPPVTETEARRYLDRIVTAAQQRDFDALCHLNGAQSNCRRQLELAGRDAVPQEPPTIVAGRYSPKGDTEDTPGYILVVTGIDGLGRPYRTEVMVFRENRYSFKAINAVYWSNYKVIEDNTVQPDPQPTST